MDYTLIMNFDEDGRYNAKLALMADDMHRTLYAIIVYCNAQMKSGDVIDAECQRLEYISNLCKMSMHIDNEGHGD